MKNYLFSFLFPCLLLCGCGAEGVPFTGKVTFEDGAPVKGGTVVFESGSTQYDGQLTSDGSYSLGGGKEKSGIPNGNYKIAVIVPANDDGTPGIPEKYANSETSGLTFEVKSGGPTTFDIQVEKP